MAIEGTRVVFSMGSLHNVSAFDFDDPLSFYSGTGAWGKLEGSGANKHDLIIFNEFEEMTFLPADQVEGIGGVPLSTTKDQVCRFEDTSGNITGSNLSVSDAGTVTIGGFLNLVLANGNITLASAKGINPSTDTDVIINRVRLGPIDNPDHMVLSHEDNHTVSNFCIAHSNAGRTLINTATGLDMLFSVGGQPKIRFSPLGAWEIPPGTEALPALSFILDKDTGIYSSAPDTINVITGATNRLAISSLGLLPTVSILGINGTNILPTYSFNGDTNTGMYRNASDEIGFATGGARRLIIKSTGLRNGINGSAGNPSYSWNDDPNTGIYRIASDRLGFATGGGFRLEIRSTGLENGVVGTATNPSYTWAADNNTGMYRVASDQLGLTTGGALRLLVNNTKITAVDDFEVSDRLIFNQGSNLSISASAITIVTSTHLISNSGTLNTINGTAGDGTDLVLSAAFAQTFTIAHAVGNILTNTGANVVFATLESAYFRYVSGTWRLLNGTNP